MAYPSWPLLAQGVALAVLIYLQPDAYSVLCAKAARLLIQFGSCLSLALVTFVSLFCVTVLSGDIAYCLVRVQVPQQDVWSEAVRARWAIAWFFTWMLQVPFWVSTLQTQSPLLVHEQVNLVLTIHQALLRRFAGRALLLPSAALLASTEGNPPSHRQSLVALLLARSSLPVLYVLCHGVPAEWPQVLCCFLIELGPVTVLGVAAAVGLLPPERLLRYPWAVSYPVAHVAKEGDEDECHEHGVCPVCLANLCCARGPLAVADLAAAVRRRTTPGVSAVRQRLHGAAAAGLSAARVQPGWYGSRIATTRCGHRFHLQCLVRAAEALPRCPQCRSGFHKVGGEQGVELPDEEVLDAQRLCVAFGLLLGCLLLATHCALHWVVLVARAPPAETVATLRKLLAKGAAAKGSAVLPLLNATAPVATAA